MYKFMKNNYKENVSCTCSEVKVGTFTSLTSFGNKKGFTLIELLVVISIIGVLSSVVLASLSSARGKARDTAIRQDVSQMVRLMALNYSDYESYANLQASWDYNQNDCNTGFTGNYATQMANMCSHIVSLNNGAGIHTGVQYINGNTTINSFSIMAYLPYAGQWLCAGSSGAISDKTTSVYATWVGPGCWSNP
jgi:prepilin-type N-terminal cleavage/methylation domain-containing protein